MLFSGGLIPLFMVVKNLGLYNSRWALILCTACSVWNIIISRVFIESNIPDSLIESARIDGYNDIWILAKIVAPLSKPIIAIVAMFNAIGYWNQYFLSMIFAPKKELAPLQIWLMQILIQNRLDFGSVNTDLLARSQQLLYMAQVKYVIILMSILPIIMVYPFVQKYFVKGVMIGAIKE